MKKQILLTIIFLYIISTQSYAQWFLQFMDPNPYSYIHHIDFISADTGWAVGPWEMLGTNDGGNNWDTLIIRSESNTTMQAVSFVNGNTGWYLELDGDQSIGRIYKTDDGGYNWNLQYTTPQFTVVWDLNFINEDIGFSIGYSAVDGPVFFKTTDGGLNWTVINIDLYGPEFFKIFFIDPLNGWAAGDGVYRTTDGGDSWFSLIQSYVLGIQDIQFTTPEIGYYSDIFSVQKTTDGGYSWTVQTIGGDGWHTSSVYFIDSDTGYFCPYDQIKKTTDGGASWVTQLLGGNADNLIDVQFVTANIGWAVNASPFRIFHTINGGTPVELVSFTANMENNKVILDWTTSTETNNRGFDVERQVHSQQSSVGKWEKIGFVGGFGTTTEPKSYSFTDNNVTAGNYSYRLKQIDFDGSFEYSKEVEVEVSVPLEFSLSQNYPNPFNPSTMIKYSTPKDGYVNLKIYNTLGQQVAELVNGIVKAGSHQITFNAGNLSSGVYYYRIESGDYVSVRKMMILK